MDLQYSHIAMGRLFLFILAWGHLQALAPSLAATSNVIYTAAATERQIHPDPPAPQTTS